MSNANWEGYFSLPSSKWVKKGADVSYVRAKITETGFSDQTRPAPDQPHIFVENEFDSLVTFCQETCNTSLLFIMIEHLVVKFESRWATVTSKEFRDQVTAKKSESGPFVYVVGGRRSDQPPLAGVGSLTNVGVVPQSPCNKRASR